MVSTNVEIYFSVQNTVQSLQAKLQEDESLYSSLESDKISLQRDFDELLVKFQSTAGELDKCKEENVSLLDKLMNVQQDFQTKSEKHKFEV